MLVRPTLQPRSSVRSLSASRNCVALAVTVAILATFARAEFETPTAITNVTIVNPDGSTIEKATIVIEDGRITAAGATLTIPPQAEVVDADGLFAYPGFVDAHNHLGIAETARTAAERERTEDVNPDLSQAPLPAMHMAGRRGVRAQTRAIQQYVPDVAKLESYRNQGFTTALIAPRDGIFSGTSDLLSLSGNPIRQSIIASNVGMHASFTTGEDGGYPQTLLGVFAQFRQALLDAQWNAEIEKHRNKHAGAGERAPEDAALDALLAVLGGQRLIFEANSEVEIRRALDLAAEFKLNIAITGAKEAHKAIDRIKAEKVPLIVTLKFDEEPEYGRKKKDEKKKPEGKDKPASDDPSKTPDDAKAAQDAEQPESGESKGEEKKDDAKEKKVYEPLKVRQERRRLWEEQVANVIRLHEAGVPFSLRTKDFKDPAELLKNLRLVIDRGLPESAALAALTVAPAELLGQKGRLGEIAPGRFANLVLLDKPLKDEKAKAKFVFADGKKFELDREGKQEAKKDAAGEKPGDEKQERTEGTERGKGAAKTAGDVAKKGDEAKAQEVESKSPSFAAEVLADRIPKTKTGGNVLVKNATILPVTSDPIVGGSILIQNGKIAALGSSINVPSGVTVIDGTGWFVMPGIIDCHSHLGIDGINEGAHSISAEVRIGDLIDPHDISIFRAAAGGATTHHAMHGSANTIGGQCVVFKLKYERPVSELLMPSSPRTIKFALGENVKQSNFFEAFGKRYPNTRLGVESTLRVAFESARQYQREWNEYEQRGVRGTDIPPPRRDLKLDALSDVLAGKITVHCHCYRSDEILRLIDVAEDYGIRIGVWHHVLEGYRIAPELARHGGGASSFANMWAYKIEAYGAIPHNNAFMEQAGICTTVNSDSANTIRYMNQEAAKCIRWGGLTENEALRLITLHGAKQLEIEDRVGSLEVGKDGDLAIYNGHPLNTFAKNVMTIIDGEVFFEDSRPEPTEKCDFVHIPTNVVRTIPVSKDGTYAIVGATVHPMSPGALGAIGNATVVVSGGKIQSVGANLPAPAGAAVIDGKGLHVYPGLIDGGSVLGLNEIDMVRSTRDQNELGTFNPHLIASNAVHPHSVHIQVARTTGITTALVKPSGGRIPGQSSVIHLDGWTAPEMLVSRSFGLHLSVPSLPYDPAEASAHDDAINSRLHGAACCTGGADDHAHGIDFDQLRGGPEDEARKKRKEDHKKAMKELEDYLAKAKHYADVKDLAAKDPKIRFETDLALEAMIPYVRGEKPVVFDANGYKPILDTIEFAEKHKLKCVIAGGNEAWKLALTLAEKKIPVILGTPYGMPSGQFEPWDSVYRCAGELDRAGVKIAFASDSSSDSYNLGTEVGMAVAHGLSRERAEYALTLGAAEILGIADRVGSIEPGKQADLIITTDTPLQTTSQITHMFIDGRPIELSSIHTESYEKFKNRPAPKLPPARTDLRGPKSLTRK